MSRRPRSDTMSERPTVQGGMSGGVPGVSGKDVFETVATLDGQPAGKPPQASGVGEERALCCSAVCLPDRPSDLQGKAAILVSMSQLPPPLPPMPPPVPPGGGPNPWPTQAFELPERPQTRLSFDGLMAEAWRLMGGNYGLLVGVVGVWIGISIAGSVVSIGLEQIHPVVSGLWDVLTLFLVDAPLFAGVAMLGVRLARGERPAFDAMFDGFRSYGPIVLINLIKLPVVAVGVALVILPVAGLIGLAGLGGGRPPVALVSLGVGVAVLLGLGVYLFLFARLYLADVLILDQTGPRPGPIDALRLSWRITGPVTITLVLLFLLGLLIAIGTALMLLIGLLLLGLPLLICMGGVGVRRMLESLDRPVCNHCGFDLSATDQPKCPECGRTRWRYTRATAIPPPQAPPFGSTLAPGG